MNKLRAFSLLSLLCIFLLLGGCANAPSESPAESAAISESAAQGIGISEPEKEEHLFLNDETSDLKSSGGAAPAATEGDTLRQKSEKRGDDMERLD